MDISYLLKIILMILFKVKYNLENDIIIIEKSIKRSLKNSYECSFCSIIDQMYEIKKFIKQDSLIHDIEKDINKPYN